MNEKEKQAIEKLDYELTYSWVYNQGISKETLKLFKDIIEKTTKKIEELDKENTRQQELIGNILQKWKDKIREKLDLIDKEYAEIIEKNKNDLYKVNINAHRHSAMQLILEELLGE